VKSGYITLACGHDKYLQMAINLGLSIKLNDPGRPICLVHDEHIRPTRELENAFDAFSLLPAKSGYVGCMNKIRLYDASPYDSTMYIDSDCIVVKNDMERHWQKLSGKYFNYAGTKRSSGHWYNFDIAEVCRGLGVSYIVEGNSGVFYFERGSSAEAFFATANNLFETQRQLLGCVHQGRNDQYADEPFFAAAMGQKQIEPIGYVPEEGSIMVTTVWAKGCEFDPIAHVSRLNKAKGYVVPKLWARGWQPHSPSIAHFVALKPKAVYQRAANQLRARFGFPAYSFA
jgi:hypothetical protein